jgi:hypothetical protein
MFDFFRKKKASKDQELAKDLSTKEDENQSPKSQDIQKDQISSTPEDKSTSTQKKGFFSSLFGSSSKEEKTQEVYPEPATKEEKEEDHKEESLTQ